MKKEEKKQRFFRFPFKIEFAFIREHLRNFPRNITWIPEGCAHSRSVADISYKGVDDERNDIYEHHHFWFVHYYQIFWLCFVIGIKMNVDRKGFRPRNISQKEPVYFDRLEKSVNGYPK